MYFFVILATVYVASVSGAEAPVTAVQNNICGRRNAYVKVPGQCDAFVECRDFVPVQRLCPDGLHYDTSAIWPSYPCGYPSDVPCLDRSAIQPAKATADCPHQYGYFPSSRADPNDCGQYRMCVLGKSYDMLCPVGLAFNFESGRCDWPYLVPTCNAEKFLGFQCPAASYNESGNAIKSNHRYEGNCYGFYSCEEGKPRLLSCDTGLAFDAVSGQCVDAENVACSDNVPQITPVQPQA